MATLKNAKLNTFLKYILPSIITAFIFCIVLIIKGIYPFGISTIDFYDLSDQGTPLYTHIYDTVHGHKNLFYDVYSALTTNMTGMLGTSGISPFNLYFLLIKRESVLKCMSIFVMLKMTVMSLGMYIFLEKATKVPYVYKLVFSVCYGFSGYVLLHYTSHIWFDNVAYFPFVMAGLCMLIKERKCACYTISMTLSIICGYYISFLFFIYIVLMAGLVLVINRLIKNGKDEAAEYPGFLFDREYCFHLTELLVCTIVSILASSFILLPQINQTLASARFTNESGGGLIGMYKGILENVTPAYTSRWFILLNISFAVAIILLGLIRNRKNKKLVIFTACSMAIMCLELLFENINLLWHYGSYVHYPLRNGFMITFTCFYLACIYIENGSVCVKTVRNDADTHLSTLSAMLFICICILSAVAGMYLYSKNPGLSLRQVLHILAAVMAACLLIYILLALFMNGRYFKLAPVLIVCELIFYGYIFLGEPTYVTGYTEDPEMERDSFYMCNQLYEAFDMDEDITRRIKNPDESLNSNYALVLRRSALSNWTALISPKLQDSARRLGYTVQYTRLLDSGGTVFSDALLGIKNIITCVPQDETLYELIDTADIVVDKKTGKTDTYYYYKCKFELPYGIKLKSIDGIDFEEDDVVKLYNSIYSVIDKYEGTKEDSSPCIAAYADTAAPSVTDNGLNVRQDVNIDGFKALYYFADQVDMDDYNTTIKVNGKDTVIPSIREKDNVLYPAHFNNNAVYLGSFENETVNIDITFLNTDREGNSVESDFSPKLVTMDLNALRSLCDHYKDYNVVTQIGKTTYNLETDSDSDGYIMLPLSYDMGYTARVNNNPESVQFLGGLLMAVPVYEGNNSISIKFMPRGMCTGTVISVISAIIGVIYLVYIKRSSDSLAKGHQKLSNAQIKMPSAGSLSPKLEVLLEKLCIFAWTAVMIVMYIIPVVYSVYRILV